MASLQSVDQEVPTWIDAASEESSIGVKVKLRVTTGQAGALGHDGARQAQREPWSTATSFVVDSLCLRQSSPASAV